MKGRALAVASALAFGALCARGLASCTTPVAPPLPPSGYNQQVCLSIGSPIADSCVVPTNGTIPVVLSLNSTFALRPPGACSTNALFNCGHALFYLDGQYVAQSASMITELPIGDLAIPFGQKTITALLVDDCGYPWTLDWNDAGVVEDGGVMCLGPPDSGPLVLDAGVTNTCPPNAPVDAAVDNGPYFASVTIDVEAACGSGTGTGGTATSSSAGIGATVTSSSAGTGGAATSSSAGTGGMGTGGAGTGGAGPSDAGPSDAGPSDAGPSDAGPSDAGDGG